MSSIPCDAEHAGGTVGTADEVGSSCLRLCSCATVCATEEYVWPTLPPDGTLDPETCRTVCLRTYIAPGRPSTTNACMQKVSGVLCSVARNVGQYWIVQAILESLRTTRQSLCLKCGTVRRPKSCFTCRCQSRESDLFFRCNHCLAPGMRRSIQCKSASFDMPSLLD